MWKCVYLKINIIWKNIICDDISKNRLKHVKLCLDKDKIVKKIMYLDKDKIWHLKMYPDKDTW